MAIEIEWNKEELSPEEKERQEVQDNFVFLAREFLTWLIFFADVDGGVFEGFTITVGNKAVLRNVMGHVTDVTLKGPAMSISPDLRYNIAGGLLGKEIELCCDVGGDRQFRFALSSECLDLKRVKLPTLMQEEKDDRVDERMALLVELDGHVKAAYARFLKLRESGEWREKTVPAMQTWLEEGTK